MESQTADTKANRQTYRHRKAPDPHGQVKLNSTNAQS